MSDVEVSIKKVTFRVLEKNKIGTIDVTIYVEKLVEKYIPGANQTYVLRIDLDDGDVQIVEGLEKLSRVSTVVLKEIVEFSEDILTKIRDLVNDNLLRAAVK